MWYPGSVDTMDKVAYAKYIENIVKKRFHTGQPVTIASATFTPGKMPPTVFIIDHIQEVHTFVRYEIDTKEPRCLGIKPKLSDVVIMYPPSKLRPLNTEELKLVNAPNPETGATSTETDKAGAARQAVSTEESEGGSSRRPQLETAILGGEVVIVDRRTGEIVIDADGRNEAYSG